MTRSPDSLIPSGAEQSATEKRDDKASTCRLGGEANLRAATQVNVVSASSTPPTITPIQLDLFRRRFRALSGAYGEGKVDWEEVGTRVRAWIAHAEHGDTWRLRERIFEETGFRIWNAV